MIPPQDRAGIASTIAHPTSMKATHGPHVAACGARRAMLAWWSWLVSAGASGQQGAHAIGSGDALLPPPW